MPTEMLRMSFSTCSSFIGFCFASSPIALPPLPAADPVRRQKQAKSAPLPCARFGREWRLATRRGVLVGGGDAVGGAGGRFQRAGGEGGRSQCRGAVVSAAEDGTAEKIDKMITNPALGLGSDAEQRAGGDPTDARFRAACTGPKGL